MACEILSSRRFDAQDQRNFAQATGDYNPIHMDALAARRTLAGAPVVHGIHALLWLLDVVALHDSSLPGLTALKAFFPKMLYVGDNVEARITKATPTTLKCELVADDVVVVKMKAEIGAFAASQQPIPNAPLLHAPPEPLVNDKRKEGTLVFSPGYKKLEQLFPHASRLLGTQRLAAIGCTSCLVGMVMPGLHSLYGGLSVTFEQIVPPEPHLQFAVTSIDPRFHLMRQIIAGGGISGSLDAFMRPPPTQQISMQETRKHVDPGCFSNATALIIGGSRGLGELTAKIVAAGGGHAVITYATGKTDAERVAHEINQGGGHCTIARYDALQDAEEQIQRQAVTPTHIYYFATPVISARKAKTFSVERLNLFLNYYVIGFENLIRAARLRYPEGFSVFYPSTVFIDERPQGMTEYAMAKAAGEILCADMAAAAPKVRITTSRLPRLPTDQTASIQPVAMSDPLKAILPIIFKLQAS